MTYVQRLKGNFTITDPDWPIYNAWVPGSVWVSDSFAGPGPLDSRMTDSRLGGTPRKWMGTAGSWTVEGGSLKHLTPGGVAYFETPHQDYEAEMTIVTMPTEGSFSFLVRRTDLNFTSTLGQVIINVPRSGYTVYQSRKDGTNTTIGDSTGTKAGDVLRLRVEGNRVRGWRNDEELFDYTGDLPAGQMAGISLSGAVGAAFDDFKITAL